MGSLFRSEPMVQAHMFLQAECAYDCVNQIGQHGLVQMEDSNEESSEFERRYVGELRRFGELQRVLRFLAKECNREGLPEQPLDLTDGPAPMLSGHSALEEEIMTAHRQIAAILSNKEVLCRQEFEMLELEKVQNYCGQYMGESGGGNGWGEAVTDGGGSATDLNEPLLEQTDKMPSVKSFQLGFVAGVIDRERSRAFEKMIWRACRGNVLLHRGQIATPLLDPKTSEPLPKDTFIAFYQGAVLEEKVRLICDGFRATRYPCPQEAIERIALQNQIEARLADLRQVLDGTTEHLHKMLMSVASKLPAWNAKVFKIVGVYATLNKFEFDAQRNSINGVCWCPANQVNAIQLVLDEGAAQSGTDSRPIFTQCDTTRRPPTYHITDKYTGAFQAIVDAYGVATYQEVNPAPFTIITFPFLFAVMFGDFGHGIIMALFALYLVKNETVLEKWKAGGEIWDTMFSGRYIILLMGLFSIYTGLIYNDCFSKSMSLFGESRWIMPAQHTIVGDGRFVVSHTITDCTSEEAQKAGCFTGAYPIGVDPIWALAENKLTFTNSFKMKMSVIFGVMQMTFGVALSYYNGQYFRKPVDVYHVFLPQIIFLLSIFGYLCLMIVFKWLSKDFPNGNPPSLLLMLINMFLKFGSPPAPEEVLYGDQAGKVQNGVETFLVGIALICVPWMLLVKPFTIRAEMQKAAARQPAMHGGEAGLEAGGDGHDDDEEPHDFAEIMVHQSIHTIEFCLGCISNTASYLRLWALSLAHAQLSEVLWEMILVPAFELGSPLLLFCAFAVWASLTIAVLLIMEGLSAFLHALRLHWVEFQNKFYVGTGYLFEPFSFAIILEAESKAINS